MKANKVLEEEEKAMKTYVISKRWKEDIVLDKVEKYGYKLGIENLTKNQKEIKINVKEIDNNEKLKYINEQNVQKN